VQIETWRFTRAKSRSSLSKVDGTKGHPTNGNKNNVIKLYVVLTNGNRPTLPLWRKEGVALYGLRSREKS